MLPKAVRLTTEEIKYLSNGKSVFATLISMRFAPAPIDNQRLLPKTKFSVSVSKKIAPRAVDRNRIRRRVYAAVRKAGLSTKSPVFIMLMPKKECMTAPIEAISGELQSMFRKATI